MIKHYETQNFKAMQDSSRKVTVRNIHTNQVILTSFSNIDLTQDQIKLYAEFAETLVENGAIKIGGKAGE